METQSKADKETLLAIQKEVVSDYDLLSLYGTKYQDKALFTFAPLPLWNPNSIQTITMKFYVHDIGGYKKKEELIIYTAPYETSKALSRKNIITNLVFVGNRVPSNLLFMEVRGKIADWQKFCLKHYIDKDKEND